jgi:hypothetical protein
VEDLREDLKPSTATDLGNPDDPGNPTARRHGAAEAVEVPRIAR